MGLGSLDENEGSLSVTAAHAGCFSSPEDAAEGPSEDDLEPLCEVRDGRRLSDTRGVEERCRCGRGHRDRPSPSIATAFSIRATVLRYV